MSRRSIRSIIAVCAIALVATACGKSDDTSRLLSTIPAEDSVLTIIDASKQGADTVIARLLASHGVGDEMITDIIGNTSITGIRMGQAAIFDERGHRYATCILDDPDLFIEYLQSKGFIPRDDRGMIAYDLDGREFMRIKSRQLWVALDSVHMLNPALVDRWINLDRRHSRLK